MSFWANFSSWSAKDFRSPPSAMLILKATSITVWDSLIMCYNMLPANFPPWGTKVSLHPAWSSSSSSRHHHRNHYSHYHHHHHGVRIYFLKSCIWRRISSLSWALAKDFLNSVIRGSLSLTPKLEKNEMTTGDLIWTSLSLTPKLVKEKGRERTLHDLVIRPCSGMTGFNNNMLGNDSPCSAAAWHD